MGKWLVLCYLALVVFTSCSSKQTKEALAKQELIASQDSISLTASEELSEDFVHFTKQVYDQPSLKPLFLAMNNDGNTYCKMATGATPYSKKIAARFIKAEKLKKYRTTCKMCLKNMTAGCWNFFKMNDQRPERDFKLVHYLLAKKAYSCYSVGFLQPYIMHNYMNCANITMLDIDWRILYGHYQFVKLIKKNSFKNETDLNNNLSQLSLSWVAHHERYFKANAKASMTILCKSRQRKNCKRHILDFQRNHSAVKKYSLNLAGLHDGNYKQENNLTRVIYLSNAIERIYTSKKQFDALLKNLFLSMNAGENAILIHHVGGYPQFGLYEFQRRKSTYQVRTICKDLYTNTAFGSTEKFYETYFEKVSRSRKRIPSCQRLLRKFDRKATKKR